MIVIIIYWIIFVLLYLAGLFVFVKTHMDENMQTEKEKGEKKKNDDTVTSKKKKRVTVDTPKRKAPSVKSDYNLRSRQKDVSEKKPTED